MGTLPQYNAASAPGTVAPMVIDSSPPGRGGPGGAVDPPLPVLNLGGLGLALAALVGTGAPATTAAPGHQGAAARRSEGPSATGAMLGPWKLVGHSLAISAHADEGVATITGPGGRAEVVLRGDSSVPGDLKAQGWEHIGDPGGWGGYLVDAYQGGPGTQYKLFRLTTPTGATYDFVHQLVAGEEANNSFAAVTPDGQWMVSGEWFEMRRLLVFPSPTALVGQWMYDPGVLPLAATISLDHPVRYVQGCAFTTSTQLLCSSDDPGTDLWPTPYQLLQVTLAAPLDGQPTNATVTSLGELPMSSHCHGTFEVEGIDYQTSTGILRVEVVPPGLCGLLTTVYQYRQVPPGGT